FFSGDKARWTERRNAVAARIRAVPLVGEKAWSAPGRQPPHDAPPQLQRRSDKRSAQRQRFWKPERRNRRRGEQGVNAVVHNRSKDSREPGGEQISRGGADALVRLREPELCALVRAAPRLKGVVRRWNVPNAHASADFAPEEIGGGAARSGSFDASRTHRSTERAHR